MTAPDDEDAGQPQAGAGRVATIGRIVHDLRRDRMTLLELSERSNVSVGLLSRLENGTGNPSFRVLSSIAEALGVHVSVLFQTPRTITAQLLRPADRLHVRLPHSKIDYEILVPNLHGRVLAYLWRVPRGFAGNAHERSHDGDEFLLLLDGRIEVHVGNEVYLMEPQDTITFDAAKPHWLRHLDGSPATLLAVLSPAEISADPDPDTTDGRTRSVAHPDTSYG